jgi:hypothetical protein
MMNNKSISWTPQVREVRVQQKEDFDQHDGFRHLLVGHRILVSVDIQSWNGGFRSSWRNHIRMQKYIKINRTTCISFQLRL